MSGDSFDRISKSVMAEIADAVRVVKSLPPPRTKQRRRYPIGGGGDATENSKGPSRGCCGPCVDRKWMIVANRNYAYEYSVSGISSRYGGDSSSKIYLSYIGQASGLPGITDGDDYWESPSFNFSCCNCNKGMTFSLTDPLYGVAPLSLISGDGCSASGGGSFSNSGDVVTWTASFDLLSGSLTITYTSNSIGTCAVTYSLSPSTQSVSGSGTFSFSLTTSSGSCSFGSSLTVNVSGGNCTNAGGGAIYDAYKWRQVVGNNDSCRAGGDVWLYLVSIASGTNCPGLTSPGCRTGTGTITDSIPWVQFRNLSTPDAFRARCGSRLYLQFPQLQPAALDDLPCEVCVQPVGGQEYIYPGIPCLDTLGSVCSPARATSPGHGTLWPKFLFLDLLSTNVSGLSTGSVVLELGKTFSDTWSVLVDGFDGGPVIGQPPNFGYYIDPFVKGCVVYNIGAGNVTINLAFEFDTNAAVFPVIPGSITVGTLLNDSMIYDLLSPIPCVFPIDKTFTTDIIQISGPPVTCTAILGQATWRVSE